MTKVTNKQIYYKEIPKGFPQLDTTFEYKQEEIDLNKVELSQGQVLLENLIASVDPYMRGRMRDPKVRSYVPAFKLNAKLDTLTLSKVIRSNDSNLPEGSYVTLSAPCENYSVVKGKHCTPIITDPSIPLSYYLSILGVPGLTAYVGLYKIGQPKAGETIFISGASGAVGQIVGQLAKERGLRVIGSAGEDEKVDYLIKELKFDAAFNYKKEKDLKKILKELCPKGIDIYFDNVGGKTLEVAIGLCNDFARIPLCGMISQYNLAPKDYYPIKNLILAVPRRIKMEGFIATDDHGEYSKMFLKDCQNLIKQNKLKISESIDHGVENIPSSLLKLFKGGNQGKQLVKLSSKL
ncbi:NAD(P)-binding protein [Neoconidiobolus thromboides FSU 785]|nr:NAD(P)-binding protein [Neoconidiobolus thromboides FSU 785]